MSQRAYVQGDRIHCAACARPLAGVWEPGDEQWWPDVRGWMRDGDVYRITKHALERLRQGKRPAYRRTVPPQIPLRRPASIECWSCGLVQDLAWPEPDLFADLRPYSVGTERYTHPDN
jgi:hypothetical protein